MASRSVALTVDCGTAYKTAPDPIKRTFNQAFFEKVFVMEFDENPGEVRVTAQHRAPFDVLLGRDLKRFEADSRHSRESRMPRRMAPKMPAESRDPAYYRDKGFNTTLLVALSTADTNNWSTLLEKQHRTSELEVTAVEYERTGPILQRQKRLSEAQALLMATKYQNGATVYQLAEEFEICRSSVSGWIKKLGIPMRGQPPNNEMIDSMVNLYLAGMSLTAVAQNLGASPGTVHNHLKSRHVQMRDSHGRHP